MRPSKRLKSPFSARELREIKAALLAKLEELNSESRREYNNPDRINTSFTDEMDLADDAAASDLALRIAESDALEIAQIEKALERIDDKTYGICEVTGKPIERERLEILPFATTCIEVARKQEMSRNAPSSESVGWSF